MPFETFAAVYQMPFIKMPLYKKCPLPFGDKCPYETNAVQGQMPFWVKGNRIYEILTFIMGKIGFKGTLHTRKAHM